jgi:hypothetical protein
MTEVRQPDRPREAAIPALVPVSRSAETSFERSRSALTVSTPFSNSIATASLGMPGRSNA